MDSADFSIRRENYAYPLQRATELVCDIERGGLQVNGRFIHRRELNRHSFFDFDEYDVAVSMLTLFNAIL